ncbi:histone-like nucleoid-structuring protein Lsr2 [Amycolatopsis sp. cmx-4-61]|uniref:histone-like nucleoid-structuring protein Lsr2 n=1 Tax=Amycolatopsis sp. cmx-4-61 TaxID=2790937 RepID=UPI00397E68B5
MAQKIVVELVDDLDGSQANQTVKFGLDGVIFEIDLNDEHAEDLRTALARYVAAGRRTRGAGASRPARSSSGGGSAAPVSTDRERNREIRAWARTNGFEVAPRGRIPKTVLEAYDAKDQPAAAVTPTPASPVRKPPAPTRARAPRKTTTAATRRRQPGRKPAAARRSG